jgi:hypothetical protein
VIHVEIVSGPVVPPQVQAHVQAPTEMHYNSADRRFVGVFTIDGRRCVNMIIPAKSEKWVYGEAAKELAITSSNAQSAIAMMTWGADDPLKLADLLEKWDADRSRGSWLRRWFLGGRLPGAEVTRTQDGEFIRFDLTPPNVRSPAKSRPTGATRQRS